MVGEAARKPRLVWKYEDGPGDEEDDRDMGPVWLDDVKMNSGRWMTRGEARRLAEAKGYELVLDG